MTTLRYKFIKNTTGAVITATSDLVGTDGDNKQEKVIRRVLAAGDIGNAAGQTGHASGMLLDVITNGYNVLSIQGLCYRPTDDGAGVNQYTLLDNLVAAGPLNFTIAYKLNPDNTIRVINTSYAAGAAVRFLAGDIVNIRVILGKRENPLDIL